MTNFTTPVGRLVGGSLYEPQDKDADGKPLLIKNGPNVGKPTQRFWLPFAVRKGAEQHWNQTPLGQIIWKAGQEAFPQSFTHPTFAWKVVDGDSQVPNKRGRKPADNEGYPGHWVFMFGGSFAPKVVAVEGGAVVEHKEPDFVKPGYFIEIMGSVSGNGSQQTPGVYLNYTAVCMRAFGEEIQSGPDLSQAGFGQAPLPPGASVTPVGGFEQAAVPHGLPAAAPGQFPERQPAPAPIAVQPHPGFLNPQPAVVQPAPAPTAPPAPAPAPMMTAKATATYDAYRAAGWTDAQLREHGLMV